MSMEKGWHPCKTSLQPFEFSEVLPGRELDSHLDFGRVDQNPHSYVISNSLFLKMTSLEMTSHMLQTYSPKLVLQKLSFSLS